MGQHRVLTFGIAGEFRHDVGRQGVNPFRNGFRFALGQRQGGFFLKPAGGGPARTLTFGLAEVAQNHADHGLSQGNPSVREEVIERGMELIQAVFDGFWIFIEIVGLYKVDARRSVVGVRMHVHLFSLIPGSVLC